MNLEMILIALAGTAPLSAIAIVFTIVGWRALHMHHRRAAIWLVLGMGTFALQCILGSLYGTYASILRLRLREQAIEIGEFSMISNISGFGLQLLLAAAIVCLGMAAISSRQKLGPGESAT